MSKPNLFSTTNSEPSYAESYQGKQVELTQEELDKVCFFVNIFATQPKIDKLQVLIFMVACNKFSATRCEKAGAGDEPQLP
jgi:hypothetical protein